MYSKKILLFSFLLLFLNPVHIFSQADSNVSTNQSEQIDMASLSTESDDSFFSDVNAYNFNEEVESPSVIGLFVRMIVVLLIVVILIYFIFFFIKRKTNAIKDDDEFLRRVAYLNLAPGKTVEVVTLIDKAFLIGVTDERITLLGEIDDKELIQAMNLNADKNKSQKKPVTFDEVLSMFMGNKSKNVNVYKDSENKINNFFGNK